MVFPEFEPEDCEREECKYLLATTDAYGTGDSPTTYECECSSAAKCPLAIPCRTCED